MKELIARRKKPAWGDEQKEGNKEIESEQDTDEKKKGCLLDPTVSHAPCINF